MARVLKNYKTYKGFKIAGGIGLPISMILWFLAIMFFNKYPVQAILMLLVALAGFMPSIILLNIASSYGEINSELDKSLSLLDDSHIILYDLTLREYNNANVSAFVISPQGAYCINLVATRSGKIFGNEQMPKWRTYNRLARKRKNTLFDNPIPKVCNQTNTLRQKMSSSGININIIPMIVFKNKTDLSEVRASYPLMHTSDAVQFINQNRFPLNISPEQVAATLER